MFAGGVVVLRRKEQRDSVGTRGSKRRSWTVFVVSTCLTPRGLSSSLVSLGLANIRRRAIALKEQRRRMKAQQEGSEGVALGDEEEKEELQSEEVWAKIAFRKSKCLCRM